MENKTKLKLSVRFIILLILCPFLFPEDGADSILIISEFRNRDPGYNGLQKDIEDFYRSQALGTSLPELKLYSYTQKKGGSLFDIASAAGITYDALASLNRIEHSGGAVAGDTVIIPSVPGIFVPRNPSNELEYLLSARRIDPETASVSVNGEILYFLPGEGFNVTERSYFLGIFLSLPVKNGILSSLYGRRTNPFTSDEEFHGGIDIAVPIGTEVYAVKDGIVVFTGEADVYGKIIIISHDGYYQSVYGHLSLINVEKDQAVKRDQMIGLSGNSGLSTGPHLHFEIRKESGSVDPGLYINENRYLPAADKEK